MNWSLNWFKSKKKEELESLQVERQKIENDFLKATLEAFKEKPTGYVVDPSKTSTTMDKPYKSIKLINGLLTVITKEGNVIMKNDVSVSDFRRISSATSENELYSIIDVPRTKEEATEVQKVVKLSKGFDILKSVDDFEVTEDSVIMKGTGRTLPALLIEKFADVVKSSTTPLENNDEYQSLKRFFMWCCLNPRAEVANDLYDFLMKNSFRITKQGFFVALRNVISLPSESGKSSEIVDFVSNSYNKIKAVWKKDPAKFEVYKESNQYVLHKTKETDSAYSGEWVGNLKELYLDLPNMVENRFTDAYTRTFDIRVGKVVNMPPEKCNWGRMDCMAAGLHFTSDEIHYVGCGDTSVLILINPMTVVGIGEKKGRCYEYLPIMTVPRDEATKLLHDLEFDTLELDEDFTIRELENLSEKVKKGFTAETTKHQFNIPAVSSIEVKNIIDYLSKMKSSLTKRVSSIV